MSNFELNFSTTAPSKEFLKTFFEHAQVETSDVFIKSVITYKPHPALSVMWAILKNQASEVALATLYLPPKNAPLFAPAFIANFIVDTSHRRVGVGSYLLQELEYFCKNNKTSKLALEFTVNSLPFWEDCGFKKNAQFPTLLFKDL